MCFSALLDPAENGHFWFCSVYWLLKPKTLTDWFLNLRPILKAVARKNPRLVGFSSERVKPIALRRWRYRLLHCCLSSISNRRQQPTTVEYQSTPIDRLISFAQPRSLQDLSSSCPLREHVTDRSHTAQSRPQLSILIDCQNMLCTRR